MKGDGAPDPCNQSGRIIISIILEIPGKGAELSSCVDSGLVGVDGCLRAVTAYLEELCRALS